jgi:hypothetical protein
VYGSYRRDDFADPDAFLALLGTVLERYSDPVIRECCSPLSGIVRKCKFPPSVAEIVEFCDAEKARADRLKRFSSMRFEERAPRPVDPTARANLLVPFNAPAYEQMAEWAKQNPQSSRFDPRGVWVPMFIYTDRDEQPKVIKSGLRRYSADELKALYAKPLEGEPT